MSFELWVPGRPKTKQRPRFSRKGKHAYTPKETSDEEDRIAQLYLDEHGPVWPGPIAVEIHYSKEGQRIVMREAEHSSKLLGDIDNYVKLSLDGLQKTGAFDDRMVVELLASKS